MSTTEQEKSTPKQLKTFINFESIVLDFEIKAMTAIKDLAISPSVSLENPRTLDLIAELECQIQRCVEILKEHEIKEEYLSNYQKEIMGILKEWINSGMDIYPLDTKIKYLANFYKKIVPLANT